MVKHGRKPNTYSVKHGRKTNTYSASRSKRRTKQIRSSEVGTHVRRGGKRIQRETVYIDNIARKARIRRILTGLVAVLLVVGLAVGAGLFVFRMIVGSEMALKDSDATTALVTAKSDEPSYTLISVELGSVAEPLDNGGPDLFLLVRIDEQNQRLALIDIPGSLQITTENESNSLAHIAQSGDAALITAVASFAKVDISHYVKVSEEGVVGLVDALGGIGLDVDQVIDDPHAGTLYLPAGWHEFTGEEALVYLRADNLKMGIQDRMNHQLVFAATVIEDLFSKDGSLASKFEAIGPYIQTDYAFSDLEVIYRWLGGVEANDISCAMVPGYTTEVTNVKDSGQERFIATSADMVGLIQSIADGQRVAGGEVEYVDAADPGSFTLEVQNGTDVTGAAASIADELKKAGFNITEVGNAEQPIYQETLVVYQGDEGASQAKAVIDSLGMGRAVDGSTYYALNSDVLLIIGSDYKPVA